MFHLFVAAFANILDRQIFISAFGGKRWLRKLTLQIKLTLLLSQWELRLPLGILLLSRNEGIPMLIRRVARKPRKMFVRTRQMENRETSDIYVSRYLYKHFVIRSILIIRAVKSDKSDKMTGTRFLFLGLWKFIFTSTWIESWLSYRGIFRY